MRSFNKQFMATMTSPASVALYDRVKDFSGREYNRAISGPFIDDMLALFDEDSALQFTAYIPIVLPLIQSGMFDTAAKYLGGLELSEELGKIRDTIVWHLEEADDVTEQNH